MFHVLHKYSTTEQQGPSSSDIPSTSPIQRSVIHKPFTQSRIPPDLPMHPAPRHITEEELSVLEGCLHRWRTEVENDTRGTIKMCRLCSSNLERVSENALMWVKEKQCACTSSVFFHNSYCCLRTEK